MLRGVQNVGRCQIEVFIAFNVCDVMLGIVVRDS